MAKGLGRSLKRGVGMTDKELMQMALDALIDAGSQAKGEEHMKDYSDKETQRNILIDYLHVMISRNDWHGVSDAANDLRVLEAEMKKAND